MKFECLPLLRRDHGTSRVFWDVLKALELPMPDDVLEQVVYDHGLNEAFQEQYGHLDLHALGWRLEHRPAEQLVSASVYARFTQHVYVADRTAAVATAGWQRLQLPPGAAEAWQASRTWLRPPVLLDGTLVGATAELHLMEGHTRLGALTGLLRAGLLEPGGNHAVWIGRAGPRHRTPRVSEGDRITFLGWLFDQMGRMDAVGELAMWLVDARPSGEDVDSVAAHVRLRCPAAQSALTDALTLWERAFESLDCHAV